jgi:hypothetical protein
VKVACASRRGKTAPFLRAEVELMPWKPRFEISHRRVVPVAELMSHLWMENGLEPIYRRALKAAGLM